ncbi:MAG: ATP-binding protein [Magnetococcales bacterium]|nr:ATP-binding protein [Magnetococcales bacterium]
MLLSDAVKIIVENIKELNQKILAEAASVNQGQLSRWFNHGTDFSQKSRGRVISALVRLIDDLAEKNKTDYRARFSRELALIEASEDYKALVLAPMQLDPESPIPAGNPVCMHLPCWETLKRELDLPPLRAAIVGGVKTGKSTLLERAEQYLERKGHHVFRIDAKVFNSQTESNFFVWLDQVCRVQLPNTARFSVRLKASDKLAEWLEKNILKNLKEDQSCTFLIDHINKLNQVVLKDLSFGLHEILGSQGNLGADVGLLAAYDETGGWIYDLLGPASFFYRQLRTISVLPVPESEVEKIINIICNNKEDQATLVDGAWEYFQGHPYLTFRYTRLLADGMLPDEALALLAPVALEQLVKPLLAALGYKPDQANGSGEFDNPAKKLIDALVGPKTRLGANRAMVCQWLVDSRLCRWNGQNRDFLIPSSEWLSDRLREGLAKA